MSAGSRMHLPAPLGFIAIFSAIVVQMFAFSRLGPLEPWAWLIVALVLATATTAAVAFVWLLVERIRRGINA